MNSRDEFALSTTANSVREAIRQQPSQLMQATRGNFRPLFQSFRRSRGRPKQILKKYTLFLLRRSNADYYPTLTEFIYLQENGFGKKIMVFKLNWSMTRIQRCICEMYSRVQLESVGFRFGKCTKDKKIIILTVNTFEELMNEVPRGMIIIIIPNRDLSCPDYTIANNANVDESYENSLTDLGRNRQNRSVTTRHSFQQNSGQDSSESDDNYPGTQVYSTRNRRTVRRESTETRSDFRSQPNNDESENFQNQNIQNQDGFVIRQASQINQSPNEFASNILNLDNFAYTEVSQEFSNEMKIEYPDLPNNGEMNTTDVTIKRENIIEEMLTLYKDENI